MSEKKEDSMTSKTDEEIARDCAREIMLAPTHYLSREGEENTLTNFILAAIRESKSTARQDTKPAQLFLCEINNLFLHPNQLYIFQQAPECQGCADYAQGKTAARQDTERLEAIRGRINQYFGTEEGDNDPEAILTWILKLCAAHCGLDEGEKEMRRLENDIEFGGVDPDLGVTEPHKAEDAPKQKEPLTNYVTDARIIVMRGIDRSPNLPDYVKPLAKALATPLFSALGQGIGGLELTVYRTEQKQLSVQERSESDSAGVNNRTCIHHTDAERSEAFAFDDGKHCPVCTKNFRPRPLSSAATEEERK